MSRSPLLFSLLLICIFLSSCSTKTESFSPRAEKQSINYFRNLEETLSRLESFLIEMDSNLPTKSGHTRRIGSIEPYYAKLVTKSSEIGDSSLVNAYLINFDDNEGFAVLGATILQPEIICITEHGHIYSDLTIVDIDSSTYSTNNDASELDLNSIDPYCEADDDYYTISQGTHEVLHQMISCALDNNLDNTMDPPSPNNPGGSPKDLYICDPLLQTKWGQSLYGKYCQRKNLLFQTKPALPGCSTTALSMMMAYDAFPSHLTVNDSLMNWASMRTARSVSDELVSPNTKENILLLMGYIYNSVDKIAVKDATLITPEQIKLLMQSLGFLNVVKHSGSSCNRQFLEVISSMLRHNKPVFISAIPSIGNWHNGHSWVVDGARYFGNEYLLHFNFGWSGLCDGYFSPACIKPASSALYDNELLDNTNSEYNYEYTWHFRLISYDLPSSFVSKTVYF